MKKALVAAVAALPVALVSAGCGGSNATTTTSSPATTTPVPATTAAAAAESNLPVVAGAFGTKPTITLPSSGPAGYKVKVLNEGTGPVVKAGDQITVNYLGETWRGGKVFDESYGRGQPVTFQIGVGQLIPGWDEGLVGKKVGSRVLLVLPPDKGYGAAGNPQAGIEGTDTLVFVVDIVGATS